MNKAKVKDGILSTPFVGYVTRVIVYFIKAPRINDRLNSRLDTLTTQQGKRTEDIVRKIDDLTNHITGIDESLKEMKETLATLQLTQLKEINETLATLQLTQDNLQMSFNRIKEPRSNIQGSGTINGPDLFADDHSMDVFYTKFEDRFRGTEELITERLKEYLPLFLDSPVNFSKTPVLDIGSGRGEFLQLLASNHIKAIGIDINEDMVNRSKLKGLEVSQGDALAYIQKSGSQKYGAITGFHIVEHIPFNVLMKLFTSAHASLQKGGFVLFETPNPENVTVGTSGFYMDPSHLNPIPPDLLAFTLEGCGFRKVEIIRLHPPERPEDLGVYEQIANYFYGPLDYAVVGYK